MGISRAEDRVEWREDKVFLGRVSRFSEEGEPSSLSLLERPRSLPRGGYKAQPRNLSLGEVKN